MSDPYDNDDILQQFGAQKSDGVTINAENINILNTVDTLDASAALKLHRGFSMKDLDIEVEKAHKYVDSVKKACVAANLSIPFVEQTVEIEKMNINYIGAEIVFEKETSPVIQESYLEMQKKKGRILWGNAILYSSRVPLAAGHSDDVSLTDDPAKGWGWLADKGFDIIQTDWTKHCVDYLKENNYRK
jgi:hypothetical protein